MNLSLKILETNQIIQKEILQALLPQVDIYMTRIMGNLKEKLPPIVSKAITNRPEYMSLVSGRLRLELGIPDASTKVSQLIQIWISNIQYTYIIASKVCTIKFWFYFQPVFNLFSISPKIIFTLHDTHNSSIVSYIQ